MWSACVLAVRLLEQSWVSSSAACGERPHWHRDCPNSDKPRHCKVRVHVGGTVDFCILAVGAELAGGVWGSGRGCMYG